MSVNKSYYKIHLQREMGTYNYSPKITKLSLDKDTPKTIVYTVGEPGKFQVEFVIRKANFNHVDPSRRELYTDNLEVGIQRWNEYMEDKAEECRKDMYKYLDSKIHHYTGEVAYVYLNR